MIVLVFGTILHVMTCICKTKNQLNKLQRFAYLVNKREFKQPTLQINTNRVH